VFKSGAVRLSFIWVVWYFLALLWFVAFFLIKTWQPLFGVLSVGLSKHVTVHVCIDNQQAGFERLCMSVWILHLEFQKTHLWRYIWRNWLSCAWNLNQILKTRPNLFIFQGLQRLFSRESNFFFCSKERWNHSGSLLAVSFRTFICLTFVSESSFDRRWVSRLVDYVSIARKPNVARKWSLSCLNKTVTPWSS